MPKRTSFLLMISLLVLTLAACATTEADSTGSVTASQSATGLEATANTTTSTQETPEVTVVPISVEYDDDDLESSASSAATATSTSTDGENDADTDDEIVRPDGWSEETHDKSADPDYDVVFPQDEVNRIDIVIEPENWQAMMDDMTSLYGAANTRASGKGGGRVRPGGGVNPVYVPVTVEFEGDTWTNVGLRFKGNSSLRSTWGSGNMKLPLRLDFDQFEDEYPEIDDQRFYGFKQLTFSSGYKDASFLREKVTADIFREAGVPAAQTAFYQVYVDYGEGPIYFGLYTAVEVVDDTVIETQFDDDDGNVYKPEGSGASFAVGTFSEQAFEKQTNQDEGDWSDIEAVFDALHAGTRTSDPETWRAGLEAVFDVDGFLNWLAVNTVVQNWDTYGGMTHNYYLYHDPTTDQIVWIPWDNNEALSSRKRNVRSLGLDEVGANWPLIRYLLDDEVYYAQYVAYVDAVINTAFDPEKMETTYRELAALIEPYALSENAEHTLLPSEADFYAAIEGLVEHAYARYDAAAEFVAGQQ